MVMDLLNHWTAENFLKFNVSKCKYNYLSWSEHMNSRSVCIKARKVIGVLYRHFYANTDRKTLLNYILPW